MYDGDWVYVFTASVPKYNSNVSPFRLYLQWILHYSALPICLTIWYTPTRPWSSCSRIRSCQTEKNELMRSNWIVRTPGLSTTVELMVALVIIEVLVSGLLASITTARFFRAGDVGFERDRAVWTACCWIDLLSGWTGRFHSPIARKCSSMNSRRQSTESECRDDASRPLWSSPMRSGKINN